LEVLDPEQNHNFSDHYLEIPFDLSSVMFIMTANYYENIPRPLLDRMEVIHLSGYTEIEKVNIAVRHLVPKQMKAHGLSEEIVKLEQDAILKIVRGYTRESGVRNLKERLPMFCVKLLSGS
jgi:ATP-dependent Lon protease